MSATIVHNPGQPHRCELGDPCQHPPGTIARCDECGTFSGVKRGEIGPYWAVKMFQGHMRRRFGRDSGTAR